MKELEKMPYWTPAGIVMDEPPPAYAALWNDETETDWEKLLDKHGYEPKGRIGQEFSLINVIIWRQQEDELLMVEHDIAGGYPDITFFIRADDVGAWSLDGYIKLVQASAQADQAAALSRLSKSIIAFIRHGHGEDTIDEYGDWSLDDQIQVRELRELRARAREKKEAPGPISLKNVLQNMERFFAAVQPQFGQVRFC
jgi:hypothetical protein